MSLKKIITEEEAENIEGYYLTHKEMKRFNILSHEEMTDKVREYLRQGLEPKAIMKKLDLSSTSFYRFKNKIRFNKMRNDERHSFKKYFNLPKVEVLQLIRKMKDKEPVGGGLYWTQIDLARVIADHTGRMVPRALVNRILKQHNIIWKDIRYNDNAKNAN